MSGIACLYEVPADRAQFAVWSTVHVAHHRDINRLIYQNFQIALPEYMLDPFNPEDEDALNNWLYLHQAMHDNFEQILGIAGFDLTDVDWKDRQLLEFWTLNHANEHFQAADILEIG